MTIQFSCRNVGGEKAKLKTREELMLSPCTAMLLQQGRTHQPKGTATAGAYQTVTAA